MKILLVEDDPETAEHVSHALRAPGHDVDESRMTAPRAWQRARSGEYAALIVDRMLPGLDGLSLVKQLRAEGSQTPVLFLTTMSGHRRPGGRAGRRRRRLSGQAFRLCRAGGAGQCHDPARRCTAQPHQTCGPADLEMDLIRRTVHRGGKAIELQAQEFRLLEYLMRNAGRVVTRTMLLENVWELHFDPAHQYRGNPYEPAARQDGSRPSPN